MPRWITNVSLALVLASSASVLAQQSLPPPNQPPKVIVTLNGEPATGVKVFAQIGTDKREGLDTALKAVTEKFAKGTRVEVYRKLYEAGGIDIIACRGRGDDGRGRQRVLQSEGAGAGHAVSMRLDRRFRAGRFGHDRCRARTR